MKWLHLSDLHFGYTNNATNNLRKLMIDYITEISKENEYKYLFITGDIAHSKSFSETAFSKAKEPKELYIVEGNCMHIDLYDTDE